jgi:transcriptional regulator with XRE-family HTH domain
MAQDLKQRIGMQVRLARRRAKLSQEKLAERIDRTVETISNIERGTEVPNLQTLDRLSRALGIPIREFFADGSDPRSNRRAIIEAGIATTVRELSDSDAEVALGLIEALANGRRAQRKGRGASRR